MSIVLEAQKVSAIIKQLLSYIQTNITNIRILISMALNGDSLHIIKFQKTKIMIVLTQFVISALLSAKIDFNGIVYVNIDIIIY